jgi:hypothetical protein
VCVNNAFAYFISGHTLRENINKLDVGLYFDYDFDNNELSINWKDSSPTMRVKYIVQIYKHTGEYISDDSCVYAYPDNPDYEIDVTTVSDLNILKIPNFQKGKYKVYVRSLNNDNTTTVLFTNEFWVTLLPLDVQYKWCYDAVDNIRTRLYINHESAPRFIEYVDLNSDRKTFSDHYKYGTKVYMTILNYEDDDNDCSYVTSSDLGNYTIGYAVMPPKINSDTIVLKQCP